MPLSKEPIPESVTSLVDPRRRAPVTARQGGTDLMRQIWALRRRGISLPGPEVAPDVPIGEKGRYRSGVSSSTPPRVAGKEYHKFIARLGKVVKKPYTDAQVARWTIANLDVPLTKRQAATLWGILKTSPPSYDPGAFTRRILAGNDPPVIKQALHQMMKKWSSGGKKAQGLKAEAGIISEWR